MSVLNLDAIEQRFGAGVRARREHDPAVQDVLALTAEVRRLRDTAERVRELHTAKAWGMVCGHCAAYWPCATIRALDGAP